MFRLLVFLMFISAGVAHATPLTLAEATAAALERDPMLQRLEARGTAIAESAVADGALPDPELMAGIAELPVDGFGISSGEMRMYELGVAQRFPPRGVRRNAAQRGERLADAQYLLADDRRLAVTAEVARAWLGLLQLHETLDVVRDTRRRFDELAETVESRYAQGVGGRDDVLQVRIEQIRLDERESRVRQELGAARAALARWVGAERAARPLDRAHPSLPDPVATEPDELHARLAAHPRLQAYGARVDAGLLDEAVERGRYGPAFGLSFSYMRRTGRFAGMEMPDAVAARASVSLPLFTANRQDRRVAAAKARTWEADAERTDERYELEFMLDRALSDWVELRAQRELYERELLPAAAENTETLLNAYRAGAGDLVVLVRAQVAEYDARLQYHEIVLQLQRVRADLSYLTGEEA